MIKKSYIFLFFLAIGMSCAGQQFFFKHLTTDEGLLSDFRLTMTEDRFGRLWIGSDEGVNVFDGYELDTYSQPDKSGLVNNLIQRIFCDKHGTIWIKSPGGVQYKTESGNRFVLLNSPEKDIANSIFFGETSKGELICITGKDLFLVDQSLRVTKLAGFTELMKKYGSPLGFDRFDGDKWLIGFSRKLVLVDIATQTFIKEYNYRAAWTTCRVDANTAMVGSFARDSVALVNISTGEIENINDWPTSDGLPINGYTGTIDRVDDHRFALGCRFLGVYIVDINKRSAQHIMNDPGNTASLNIHFVRRLFISKNKTLFVHGRGLSYTQLDSPQISTVKYIVNEKGEKYDGGFSNFAQDSKGNNWISTNKFLTKWDRKTNIGKFYPYYKPSEGPLKFKTVRAVMVDQLDRPWVFTFGGGSGMLKPDGSYEQFRRDTLNPLHSMPSNECLGVNKDNKGNFIICTNIGFTLLDPLTKTFTNFTDRPWLKRIAKTQTYYALTDKSDNWWVGQGSGLSYIDWQHDTAYDVSGKVGNGFEAMALDKEGNLYAGAELGLYFIKAGTREMTYLLGKKEGLGSDEIRGLFLDQQQMLWIVGNRGLARYDPKTKQLRNFDAKDGVETSNHALMNYFMSPNGEVFIGTNGAGFNYFFPEKLSLDKKPLNVFITSVSLPDSVINISGEHNFIFDYNQNNLSFSFLAIDFSIAPYLQYRYKLVGLDTTWVYAGKERQARYTNLAARKYEFIVEATGNGKDWYPVQHSVHVKIKVAFWNSWWFRLLVLLTIAGITYSAYRYRIAQINKAAQLKASYEIKLNELEISALRTQMNPHFIFNSLNTINSFINSNDRAQANQYISKFSRLIRLILDHSRNKKIALSEEMTVVELYMQMEQIRFEHKFDFVIDYADDIDMDTLEIPPLIIQPFVENSILHGLLPSDEQGLLKVSISRNDKMLTCVIEDNGIGREKARLNKKQDTVKRDSHGMEITLKRINLFNKENNIPDEVQIIDLENPTGTKVVIPLAVVESY